MQTPRPTRTVAVHTVAWMLVAVAVIDGSGLLYGGPAVTSSPSYAVLELMPGGMRFWGAALLAGAVAVAWGIGRDVDGHPRALNAVLAVGVGYYLIWSVVIPGTWVMLGQVPAWGALSKVLLLTALYVMCARAVAPRGRARATHEAG